VALSSEGVALSWRVEVYGFVLVVIGGAVMFAKEDGRVRGAEWCECDVEGGVVGVVG
jgi:hypothetical protein